MLESYVAQVTVAIDATDLAEAVACVRDAVAAFNTRASETRRPQRLLVDAVSIERPKPRKR